MEGNFENEVISLISEITGAAEGEITLDSNLAKEFEVDSIKAIEIAVAIEKKYKISVRDEDISKIVTPRDIVSLTKNLVGRKIS